MYLYLKDIIIIDISNNKFIDINEYIMAFIIKIYILIRKIIIK